MEWLAAGASCATPLQFDWFSLKQSWLDEPHWTFGVIGSGARFDLEPALIRPIDLPDWLGMPSVCFFRAEVVLVLHRGGQYLTIHSTINPDLVWLELKHLTHIHPNRKKVSIRLPRFVPLMSDKQYRQAFGTCKEAIRRGDVYELNLTRPFKAEASALPDPLHVLAYLTQRSPVPQATLLKTEAGALCSASPERLLLIRPDGLLVTQPIKGTRKRSLWPLSEPLRSQALRSDGKLQAENVMIADLARNDLNRICLPGSVQVPNLFEVQAFRRLHHSVTTVVGQLAPGFDAFDALHSICPPGSMTGAPKVRALQLIDELEVCEREWYAGTAGWLAPDGLGDWNVIIRSLMLDAARKRMGFHVGGAITWESDVQTEWQEGLLKASQMVGQPLG
jgi:para-aminobenzoate synthetase component 1